MKIVDLATLQAAVDHQIAHDAVRHALLMMADDGVEIPRELAFNLKNGGEIHIKGARLQSSPWIVFKMAGGGFPTGGNSGCSFLLDAETGQPRIILDDGGWLTEMRTAAAGALATDLLAVEGPLTVAIVGTGVQARYQLAALRHRRTLTDVRVWGRDSAKAKAFAEETGATAHGDIDSALAGVDAVITTTSAKEPLLLDRHVHAGIHVTAMGADMTGKRELSGDILDRATVIAGDDLATCRHAGELQYDPANADRAEALATLLAASERGTPARQSAADITVADLCGSGAFDAAIAAAAVARLGI